MSYFFFFKNRIRIESARVRGLNKDGRIRIESARVRGSNNRRIE